MEREDFFFHPPYKIPEPKAGAGVGVNIGGSDWLGLGQIFGSMSQGTELCGAKPVCWSTKEGDSCSVKMARYNDCLSKSVDLMQSQVEAQTQQAKTAVDIERQKKITRIAVISLVMVAGIIVAILILRKRKA